MNLEQVKKIFSRKKNSRNPMMKLYNVDEFYQDINKLFHSYESLDILDIGGGRGRTFDTVNSNYHVFDLNHHNSKNFIKGDITDPKLSVNKQFDIIFTKDTFEHILNPWEATDNIKKLLKEKGVFICIAPFSWRFHPSPYDAYRYSHQGLKYIFEHKNNIKEIESGYIYAIDKTKGTWPNKYDSWIAPDGVYKDCVSAFYIGIKDSNYIFNKNIIVADTSLNHD